MTEEHKRLAANAKKSIPLEQWGPYVSERQWGTVREDYSQNGDTWNYFPFDHANSRAYLWGEDGLAGISDYFQNLCFAVALWNGQDKILKERLFGLGNNEGNHGEDVKELYFYLDNLPTHYYMEYLYKYPQQAFPYEELREQNRTRGKNETEYELLDTGVFKNRQYFNVHVTYAKENSTDIGIRINITNLYSEAAPITVLPLLWFYNRWAHGSNTVIPDISLVNDHTVLAQHNRIGDYYFYFQNADDALFTDNETNFEKLFGRPNASIFVKDAFHDAIIDSKNVEALRNRKQGTRFTPVFRRTVNAGETISIYCRLTNDPKAQPFDDGFMQLFDKRRAEADEFYNAIFPGGVDPGMARVQRQALAGLLWSKQYYHYDVERWLSVSDGITPIIPSRLTGRNSDWTHLKNQDIISMPDKWEYPWYAAWDQSFQCISMAVVDPAFAKNQLLLLMREWFMKPDGQLPSYEWNFSDVNPPVQAWAAMEIYEIEKKTKGQGDIDFLKKVFNKLTINFTWWINRKDLKGDNIFEGGFLGLDNIGVFNRSYHDKGEIQLEQADGTSWMGIYAMNMMDIALEIAVVDPSFEDMVTKFFEHFVLIAEALNDHVLWNEEDQFFYDVLCMRDAPPQPLKIRSIVGLTSIYAVNVMSREVFEKLPDFQKRFNWFKNYRIKNDLFWPNEEKGDGEEMLMSLVQSDRLKALLTRLLDESEFLSDGGIRALSKYHESHPYSVTVNGEVHSIQYDPGDSTSDMFGGNSNWRGPVWIPINFIIIQSIRRLGKFYHDSFLMEYPTGSGNRMNLFNISTELSKRVISLFQRDTAGNRPIYGEYNWFFNQPENQDLILFYEYFNGDSGRGLGASHQTGWSALVAEMISELADKEK
ncbi:MGH1-like glycoside hydrolase domain-containing protein [Niabella beijingensis]|uniref:MGH1-like glycoside hydrolase domain-containing protein n=1 Tax=Niabella beijingensis TaxID=2872700 RepID=UPI001CBE8877|nr:glucosidase [Niabella beijingensis]MBZ4189793.1 glucosidase [Niabella beijingensis]